MKLRQPTVLLSLTALALALAYNTASAQSAAAPAAAAGGSDQLEEVVVTAERRTEDLQHTALAVTAVSGNELARQVIQSTADLQGLIPGAIFISDTQVAVRGISNNAISYSGVDNDLSVSMFVDGVITPRTEPGLLYDVQRVELLRGPQGTLYGRNNTAGALNIINNVPTDQFAGNASVEAGDYSRISTQGMLNTPVNDWLDLRASFITVRHDAYQSDGAGTQDDQGARFRALLKPTDKISLLLGIDYEHDGGVPMTPAFYPPGSHNPGGAPFLPWEGTPLCPGGVYVTGENCIGNDAKADNSTLGAIAELNWDLDFAKLTYIGGDRDNQQDDSGYGGSGTTHMFNNARDQWQSHELRLANPDRSPITWVAGAYYYYESARSLAVQYPPPGSPLLLYGQGLADPSYSESKAVFGQATAPLSSTFRVTAGIRYTKDTKAATQENYDTPALSDPPPAGTYVYNLSYSKSDVSYKVGLEYDFTPTVLGYLNYSTGYKAGGFFNAITDNTFKPETIEAYQGGLKTRFLDNRLQVNADLFYYNYDNFQIQTLGFGQFSPPPAPPGIGLVTLNASAARFYGGELETNYLLTRHDLISANISYLSATLTSFQIPPNPLGPADLDGYTAPYAPTASGRVSYRHTFDLDDGARVEAQAQEDLSSSYWVQIQHLAGSEQPSYHRTGVDLTYISAHDRWRVALWAKNLENKATLAAYLFALGPSPASAEVSGDPRTFGVRMSANF